MGRDRRAREEAKPLRLFAAVDLPDEAEEAIEEAIRPWRDLLPEGRWVRRENWHVTLKFLGAVWPRLTEFVETGCREAAASARPIGVDLAGLGVFPSVGRARVFWAGLGDTEGELAALAAALEERLGSEFPPERRGFTPHLTVARFNPPVPLRDHADALREATIDGPAFTIDRLILYRSYLSPRGARYEAIDEFPLG